MKDMKGLQFSMDKMGFKQNGRDWKIRYENVKMLVPKTKTKNTMSGILKFHTINDCEANKSIRHLHSRIVNHTSYIP
jgi:hypothetical protein